MLILTRSEVASLLEIEDVIDAVEDAHADLAKGRGVDLGPLSGRLQGSTALMLPMAALVAAGSGGVKLLTDTPDNPGRGMPRQMSTIILVDTVTGVCDAYLDGAVITNLRTAAASAVATKVLARQGSSVLGFIGAGSLARSHLRAIRTVRPIESVLVWSRTLETANAFASYAEAQGVHAEVLPSPRDVTRASDIVCSLTPSPEPIVLGRWFQPGLHVNAAGAPPRRDHREIDSHGVRISRVVVDSFPVALQKSGDLNVPLSEGVITEDHFQDELGQVIIGERPGRTTADEITLYKSVGIATQDIATARLAVLTARKRGVGTEIDLSI